MNVSNLQQHLLDLAKFLEAAGATKPIIGDMRAISENLTPFANHSLKAFGDFLVQAQEAVRKGEALQPLPSKGRKGPAKNKAVAADVGALAREVKDLYDRAASPDISMDHVDSVLGKLDALKKDDILIVAEAMMGMPAKKSESKGNLVKSIRYWIEDRKGKSKRAHLGSAEAMAERQVPHSTPAPADGTAHHS